MNRHGRLNRLWRPACAMAAGIVSIGWVVQQSPVFERVQTTDLATPGSLVNAWADVDGDEDLDLFVGFNGGEANRLYRNDRGTLVDVAAEAGLAVARGTRAAAWGDYDGDGDPDLLLGFVPGDGSVLSLLRNTAGRFESVTREVGLSREAGAVRQPAWVDVDADGDLDLFVAFRDGPNALFRNDDGRFIDVAADLGLADPRRTVGAVWFDHEGDGDLDLVVGNMDGDANGFFRNDGGGFTDVALDLAMAWGGRVPGDEALGTVRPCVADVNNDGRFDLFFANYGPNGLFLGRSDGLFDDVSDAWGVAIDARYDACAFADIDHDGAIDVYVNGTVTGGVSYPDSLFRQAGGRFVDVTPGNIRALQADHGVQWVDFDGDGDLDLSLTGAGDDGMHAVLRNQLSPGDQRWSLQVTVVDEMGLETLAGARVCLTESGSTRVLGCRVVDSGSGYNSQSVLPVHFGLAAAGAVDVRLSAHGIDTTVTGVDRDSSGGRLLVVASKRPAGQ